MKTNGGPTDAERDYADMRRFQALYRKADQRVRELENRLRLADELVAAATSVATEDGVMDKLSCYIMGVQLLICLQRWHEETP